MFDPILNAYINTLDVSDWPERGRPLVDRVIKEVTPSTMVFTAPPSVIEMSSDQFQSLQDQDEIDFAQEYSELTNEIKLSKEKLFYTPHCVMEVRIKGGNYESEAPKADGIPETK